MKYALVTGGSRGIGRTVSLRLAGAGYAVIVNYQSNTAAAEETVNMIRQAGGRAEMMQFDVRNKEQIETALTEWEQSNPDEYIEVLVNNAGIRRDNLLAFMTDEDWHSVLDTTLNGFFYVTRRLVSAMMTHRNGRIVNIASLSGVKGLAGQTNYSAAKAALIGATKALALEVAPRKVTVNALAPGFIATDMTKELPENELKKQIPMRRFGTAEEVAGAVAFLVSPDASYITGNVININGGLYT